MNSVLQRTMIRRYRLGFRTSLAVAVLCSALSAHAQERDVANKAGKEGTLRLYIGTYTGGASEGIYTSRLDLADGSLTAPELAAATSNPSFVALHPNRPFLYAVSEISELDGKKTGGVSAFSIEAETGRLKLLNQQPSEGSGPCHLVVDASGKAVLVANYGGGSVASLPIGSDGRLAKAASAIRHEGKSVNPQRQEGPHAHSINLDPANKFAFAADLGLDKVLVYRFDAASAKLVPNNPPSASVADGAGPRHFAFHPSGRWAYVINELASTVTALAYDADRGVLEPTQTISTLPEDYTPASYTAEVQVHPSGKFVYGSNRGHDSIAIFSVDADTGRLKSRGQQPTGGKTPRNFSIDPTGSYLLAANQESDNIVVFRIEPASGELEPTGH
ncbi:MAG: lactonase family protein, partial [Pirellulales bacterium]